MIKGAWTTCFEATCGYGYLHRELSRLTRRVVVAHPGQLWRNRLEANIDPGISKDKTKA
jgi:hypothetical protein